MAIYKKIFMLVAVMILFGCSQIKPPSYGNNDLTKWNNYRDNRWLDVRIVCQKFMKSLTKIEEQEDGKVFIEFDYKKLKETFSDVQYKEGVLQFTFSKHRYRIYLLAIELECTWVEIIDEKIMRVWIDSPPNKVRLPQSDWGKFSVFMLEDDSIAWTWEFLPLVEKPELPRFGESITPLLKDYLEKSTKKQKDCGPNPFAGK